MANLGSRVVGWADTLIRLAVGLVLGVIGAAVAALAIWQWWREAPWQAYAAVAVLALLLGPLLTLWLRRLFWGIVDAVLTG